MWSCSRSLREPLCKIWGLGLKRRRGLLHSLQPKGKGFSPLLSGPGQLNTPPASAFYQSPPHTHFASQDMLPSAFPPCGHPVTYPALIPGSFPLLLLTPAAQAFPSSEFSPSSNNPLAAPDPLHVGWVHLVFTSMV